MDYENDDIQIHEFIESVEPDYRYAGTEGYAQAMVEAVENYAIIEEYITEAEKKPTGGLWNGGDTSKPQTFKNKEGMISKFFGAIYRFIKAAIAKVKGFFATLRRKLTVLMAKGAQKVSSFINKNVNLTEIGDSEFEVKDLNADFFGSKVIDKLDATATAAADDGDVKAGKSMAKVIANLSHLGIIVGKDGFEVTNFKKNNRATTATTKKTADVSDEELEKLKDAFSDYKDLMNEATDNVIHDLKEKLVKEDEVTLNGRNVKSFYETYNNKLLKKIDKAYSHIMKIFNKDIKTSQKTEKNLRKASHGEVTSGQLTRIRYAMKLQNVSTKTLVTMKYKIMQGIASASLAVYKSGLWAALKCLGARGAHAVKSATESTSVDLFDRIR